MSLGRHALMAALAVSGLLAGPVVGNQIHTPVRAQAGRRQWKQVETIYVPELDYNKRGPGWTQRQVQRMAKKARNKRRNRIAQRRAGK
jgi:hypothetical protein